MRQKNNLVTSHLRGKGDISIMAGNIDICPFCNGTFDFKAYPREKIKNTFFYDKCSNCGGGVLKPKLKISQLKAIYKGDKYFDGLAAPVKNGLIQWVLTKRAYQTPAEWVLSLFRKGRVLDVGCGNGEFLSVLKNEGWECWGSDISSDAVRRTATLLKAPTIIKKGELTRQKFSKKFDLVSFWHVLEHLRDPGNYLLKANKLLKKGGYVVGEMPNYDSAAFKIFGSDYTWIMVPDHTLYFTEKSLKTLLKNNGFLKIKILNPPRSLLNFALSFSRSIGKGGAPSIIKRIVFVLSIPISIVLILVLSYFKRGEILRFEAQK